MPEEVGFLFALGPEFDRIGEGVHGLFVAWRLLGEKNWSAGDARAYLE